MTTTTIETQQMRTISNGILAMQEIPLPAIHESATNPRRQFDELQLRELAESIRLHGVLQPVIVRPTGDASYELVAGARRYRASKLAGRESIPATIRELSDTQCMELQLIENLQRTDVHELDEARGYAALMQLQPEVYTVEVLAEKVGRSEQYVYSRLRLTHLVEEAQQAFYAGKLSVAHAFEIARLQPNDQRRALAECFPQHRTATAVLKDKKAEAVTIRSLRDWIAREILLDITHAPFDPQDEVLLPQAGSCAACPKRTGNNRLLFPEIRQKSICTDRLCYHAKVEALVQIRMKPLEEAGEQAFRISRAPSWQVQKPHADVLYEGQYRRVAKKGDCEQTKPAVIVDGPDAGKVLYVCRDEKCKTHAQTTRYQHNPQERTKRAKELLAERVEKQTRFEILRAVRNKLPDALPRADLEMAALDYFERIGHDNHRRLSRVYGWEEKKTKTPWGNVAVGYLSIAKKAAESMNAAELHHLLVMCSLVSDLYCPGHNPREPLAKDSNLARTALRYKIDATKLASEVRNRSTKLPSQKGSRKTESKKTT
jgi:ParB family transcriptional regulator, chromosome partitioning protein